MPDLRRLPVQLRGLPVQLQHLPALLRSRDPSLRATKRGVRAAVVMSVTFAVAHAVSANPNLQLFAAFGSFAQLLFVDFPGRIRSQLLCLLALLGVGAAFIVIGTLCSQQPAAAVVVMAVVGFTVLFCGVLSPLIAAGTMGALLTFVLPVAVPAAPDQIPYRLAGWALAGALAIPAVLLVWPRPYQDRLRHQLAATARALAVVVVAHAEGRRDPQALAAAQADLADLRALFDSTTFPPTGAGPGASALAKLVGRMEWVATNVVLSHEQAATLDLPDVRDVNQAAADVLKAAANLVCDHQGCPVDDPAMARVLREALGRLQAMQRASREASLQRLWDGTAEARAIAALATTGTDHQPASATVARLAGTRGRPQDRLLGALDPTFRTRALSFATDMVGDATLEAAGFGRPPGPGGRRRERATWGSDWTTAAAHVDLRSVWFRNSLRGAVGLALAVAVVEVTAVSHGFWVVLGTLSVLRSNAAGTGATALRALAGTVVGFAVGSAVMFGVGTHYDLLWALLPVAILLSGVAPVVLSFVAAQAAFTIMVVVLFNIIEPTGWEVGLTRIEDVALGCGVSVVVGLLFWPRGATAALGRALGEAYATSSAYLLRTVERDIAPADGLDTHLARLASEDSWRRLEDAFRQYAAERGPKRVDPGTATTLTIGAVRTRVAADSLAGLARRPLDPGDTSPDAPVRVAGDALWRSCAQANRWYVDISEVLAGRSAETPPAVEHDEGLHRLMLQAFVDSSDRHRPGDVRAVLRMLWADESLEDELALQRELAGAVAQFARQRHGRLRSRPPHP